MPAGKKCWLKKKFCQILMIFDGKVAFLNLKEFSENSQYKQIYMTKQIRGYLIVFEKQCFRYIQCIYVEEKWLSEFKEIFPEIPNKSRHA